jgi:hypothetical protein
MLAVAFKEWAAVCAALHSGRQSLILRKGGVAEAGGAFRPEHSAFLLYPTYIHEHRAGLKAEFRDAIDDAETDRPPAGTVRIRTFVRVESVARITRLETALALDPLHAWTPDVVRQRFHYRTPGLFVLAVRAFRLPEPVPMPERPEYAGCKTWVPLDAPVDTTNAEPVLTETAFAAVLAELTKREL